MRLYLSSYKLGDNPEELFNLAGKNKHVGIIFNAGDFDTQEERLIRLEKNIKNLKLLGFTAEEIDLRKYFGKTDLLKIFLLKFGIIWVKGGNIFLLKRAFEQSGFDKIIHEMLDKDLVVYAGESAGSVIAGPSLEGLDIVDNAKDVPKGYLAQFSMIGLNLISYMIAPHHKSDHPESSSVEKLVKYFKNKNIPHQPLRDGEVIIVSGSKEKKICRK
ncbi:MAG: Peptidase E [Candidatus Daviesbacteria bacterium GW2011_GWB1_39_5]|uniref:Peptidase E n=1 Tax=Candidatus Nomurabacteria bacterium GW2011_GWF2_43_8 TaxID=1618779 RepID=A0A0G1HQM9_9BACT|nr:MAG: Peptidase E [Candidatus Daviesbacteria bacterium GW2011_GWB1_39_5]KKR60995.1 MAG: Peptidase E [Parcubacteria group bacterium GW2011_GWA2_40_37]KKT21917.1 MAG: Peptidase E [Candidatus Nomurabacteria bacterium GW2011_GWF2_43_8]OGI73372.1 MAG: hypothetical protein A2W56_02555 [Candidatus Nomurabacteria bacterium RIFCSPHIGHO2_02_41_18]OGJ03226.1 MAG: hypothetical protein A3G48_03455 [Candidatus Nomurabacteria bacterium RIFCSPLOWO2_12_FULL_40_42]